MTSHPTNSGVPTLRIRAAIKLLGPAEMTPTAKRMLERICDEYEDREKRQKPDDPV